MTIACLSAVYGDYDTPKPAPAGFEECVLISDRQLDVPSWRCVHLPFPDLHPRLAAKFGKCLPFAFTRCDQSVWVDASCEVTDDRLADVAHKQLEHSDLVVFAHPESRDCLYQEVDYCGAWPKYRRWPLKEQAEHYRSLGMPEHFGLWACGAIARNHSEAMVAFGFSWLTEIQRWGVQDQVSFAFLTWRSGLSFKTWDFDQRDNDLMVWHRHRDWTRA